MCVCISFVCVCGHSIIASLETDGRGQSCLSLSLFRSYWLIFLHFFFFFFSFFFNLFACPTKSAAIGVEGGSWRVRTCLRFGFTQKLFFHLPIRLLLYLYPQQHHNFGVVTPSTLHLPPALSLLTSLQAPSCALHSPLSSICMQFLLSHSHSHSHSYSHCYRHSLLLVPIPCLRLRVRLPIAVPFSALMG